MISATPFINVVVNPNGKNPVAEPTIGAAGHIAELDEFIVGYTVLPAPLEYVMHCMKPAVALLAVPFAVVLLANKQIAFPVGLPLLSVERSK